MSFIPEGAIRLNTDSQKLEFYAQDQWWEMATDVPNLGGNGGPAGDPTGNSNKDHPSGARGFIVGGTVPGSYTNKIEYFNIDTAGDTIDFGNLISATALKANVSDSTRLCSFGDYDSPDTSMSAAIDYITMSSTGDAADFGDFSEGRYSAIPVSSSTRGIWMGGTNVYNSVSGTQAGIEYVTIQSTGTAKTFGNLSQKASTGQGFQSPTRGISAGGWDPTGSGTRLDNIQYVTMASTGNSQDFGNLVVASGFTCGNTASNSIRGLVTLGNTSPGTYENVIQYITIATLGNAVEFGDLARGAEWTCGCASPTRAVFHNPGGNTDAKHMDYVAIATQGNAVDFGDTTENKGRTSAGSNAHGGL